MKAGFRQVGLSVFSVLMLVSGVFSSPAFAQSPASSQSTGTLSLDRRFPEAFGRIGPLRELSDGRVMVADPLGQLLVILDLESGLADTIGQTGGGPQEYGQPDAVFPLMGDTTLLVDLGNARLITVSPVGDFGHTIPMGQQTESGSLIVALPQGVDRMGRLYFRSELQPMGAFPDSTPLLRFNPANATLDTLALLRVPELPPPPLPGGGGSKGKAADPQDDWAVGPDGTVAVLRSGNFSVTWISPDGRRQAGPPNRFDPVRLGTAEKEMWLEEADLSRVSMRGDETGTVTVFRGTAESSRADVDMYEWPAAFPAVKPGRSQISPDGVLWVERYVRTGESPLIQRFDGMGMIVGAVRLPPGRRVGGFGQGWVFLVHTDEFGLEWIERYEAPESRRK